MKIGGFRVCITWICDGEVSVRSTVSSSRKNESRFDRAGCHGGKLSAVKLSWTVSTSRSSKIS